MSGKPGCIRKLPGTHSLGIANRVNCKQNISGDDVEREILEKVEWSAVSINSAR
jgi:hypothetical protein